MQTNCDPKHLIKLSFCEHTLILPSLPYIAAIFPLLLMDHLVLLASGTRVAAWTILKFYYSSISIRAPKRAKHSTSASGLYPTEPLFAVWHRLDESGDYALQSRLCCLVSGACSVHDSGLGCFLNMQTGCQIYSVRLTCGVATQDCVVQIPEVPDSFLWVVSQKPKKPQTWKYLHRIRSEP